MPPWIAAGLIVASVAVICAVYSLWSGPQAEEHGPHCNTANCNYHNHNHNHGERDQSRSRQSNSKEEWQERYDTPPNSRYRQVNEEECPICLDPIFYRPQHTLGCCHKLHAECFVKLQSQSDLCPICRRQF